jgi:hypothetical protein
MMQNNCPAQHRPTANADRARRLRLGSARRARIQLISDGVVASYIHDVSVRHRGSSSPLDARRAAHDGRLAHTPKRGVIQSLPVG